VTGKDLGSGGTPPRFGDNDSIQVLLTIPDGSGSISILSITPDAGGYFTFDSIAIGNHLLEIIYEPLNDTTRRFVSITPNSEFYTNYNLSGNYWSVTGSGGATGMETLRPNGSGACTDLTSSGCSNNWECVDEATADGLSSNVYETSSSFYSDTYQIENHSTGSGTIDSLVIYISCEETNSSGRIFTRIRTNGNNYDGSEENPESSFSTYSTTYTTNPSSSSAWTWAEIDNLEVGVYLRRVRCTQVYVEVYYTN